jgi:hypothetical protein
MNRPILHIAVATSLVFLSTTAHAGTTGWMKSGQTMKYGPFRKKQAYPTGVECREGRSRGTTMVRFRTSPADMQTKPFHKWNFVISKTAELKRTVAGLPLSDHPELKYRVVASDSYTAKNGENMTCAVVFRGTGPA